MQAQVTQAQAAVQQAQIESAAVMAAVGLGIDAKTTLMSLRWQILARLVGQDGKINEETMKTALSKSWRMYRDWKPQTAGTTDSSR
ncbi:MAG: hypothetical protein ACLUD2_03915 [Clostridium sp.]